MRVMRSGQFKLAILAERSDSATTPRPDSRPVAALRRVNGAFSVYPTT